tara:strand:+ start:552 stop:974 length:423 start_codon:yes stop_codon:yes gene_type:complete
MFYILCAIVSLIVGLIVGQAAALLSTSSTSIKLIKTSQMVCLIMYTKVLEQVVFHNGLSLKDYIMQGASERNILIYKEKLQAEVDTFKNRAINILIDAHPPLFESAVEFTDWNSAMVYLNKNTNFVFQHFNRETDDKTIH